MKLQVNISRRYALTLPLLTLPSFSFNVNAQAWPDKPLRFIVPVAAGGGSDMIARQVAERLAKSLGKPVVVENIAGAGGAVAAQTTARATPDGYTFMLAYVATHGTSPAARKLPYDAVKDFTPLGMIGGTPNVLVVPADLPVKSLKDFIAYAKQNVGKVNYGSSGQGSLTHLCMEQLKAAAGFFAVHVPYRGIAPAFTDMFAGSTQAMFPGLAAATPHIVSKRLRPLAVTGKQRHATLPEVPTFEENGFKGFDALQWYGIAGPANLPAEIVTRINSELNKLLVQPDFKQRLSGEAVDVMPMSPAQFKTYIAADIERWKRVMTEQKIEIEN